MKDGTDTLFDHQGGTSAPWYEGRHITEAEREVFRDTARRSREAKQRALENGQGRHVQRRPRLDPATLMPVVARHELPALSLFSGGGGLDLGFDRAGFAHVASYDTLEAAGHTLRENRPHWTVYAGAEGDVREVDWRPYRGELAVLHGGAPCQPFSVAGRQRGKNDERNLLPEFVRAVRESRPLAFVAENVTALAAPKFARYLRSAFLRPLERDYHITVLKLSAHEFGVPQLRHRIFFVGFRWVRAHKRFAAPIPTHRADHLFRGPAPPGSAEQLARTMGARAVLGLPNNGIDALAPTLRSTLTGPRHTTSILSSVSAQRAWAELGLWPNGVAPSRVQAQGFPTENGHVRLAVADCALLQGFPSWWSFHGAVYMSLGQIGNSVAPPVAYRVAVAVARALALVP